MLGTGDRAPDFTARDQEDVSHSLSDLLQRGAVVVYFYPADFTPICTAEACAFRDRFEDLNAADVSILGISPQGAESHRRFATTYGLPFPLLCDQDKKIIRSYGVDGPLGFGVRRVTFLIGSDGIIKERVVSDLFVGSHLDLIKKILENRPPQ
ncbi:MAG: peroxiredoxin [Pseudomonadales bacterium]|nr:peroxiredoxin [Pseudomonadales bacterium]